MIDCFAELLTDLLFFFLFVSVQGYGKIFWIINLIHVQLLLDIDTITTDLIQLHVFDPTVWSITFLLPYKFNFTFVGLNWNTIWASIILIILILPLAICFVSDLWQCNSQVYDSIHSEPCSRNIFSNSIQGSICNHADVFSPFRPIMFKFKHNLQHTVYNCNNPSLTNSPSYYLLHNCNFCHMQRPWWILDLNC